MKFLVAVDGSRASDRALEHAVEVAGAAGAGVTVTYAVSPAVDQTAEPEEDPSLAEAEGNLVQEAPEDAERRGRRAVDEAVETASARDADVEVETELLYGDPVEAIADYADDGGFDGVFVGHRGLSEEAERVLGSVAKGLIARSEVPVTVVG